MRCHYMSDLHLEAQDIDFSMPKGEVLLIAGDLCNAKFLEGVRTDKYSEVHRERVDRFLSKAKSNFKAVVLIAGNHEHYQFVFNDTVPTMRANLEGVTILDNESIDIDGVRFFGATLWSDFLGRSQVCMDNVRRRVGEFLLVKKRKVDNKGTAQLIKFQPEDALEEFDNSIQAITSIRDDGFDGPVIIITHHAPSPQGLNPHFERNDMDGAFVSDLSLFIETMENVPFWVHGHTHIRKNYQIGNTQVLANCLGFMDRDPSHVEFSPNRSFEV